MLYYLEFSAKTFVIPIYVYVLVIYLANKSPNLFGLALKMFVFHSIVVCKAFMVGECDSFVCLGLLKIYVKNALFSPIFLLCGFNIIM